MGLGCSESPLHRGTDSPVPPNAIQAVRMPHLCPGAEPTPGASAASRRRPERAQPRCDQQFHCLRRRRPWRLLADGPSGPPENANEPWVERRLTRVEQLTKPPDVDTAAGQVGWDGTADATVHGHGHFIGLIGRIGRIGPMDC
jgi:hypothetical protein